MPVPQARGRRVGLEPQHVLAIASGGEGAVALLERAPDALRGWAVAPGQEAGAPLAQLAVAHLRHRALVQPVAPGDDAGGQTRPAQRRDRRVTVGDVQDAGAGEQPRTGSGVRLARLGHPRVDPRLHVGLLGRLVLLRRPRVPGGR
jgi:hypothetical protein